MKFVVNHYNLNFGVMHDQPAPIRGSKLERLVFGIPPFETRDIWTFEIETLTELLELLNNQEISFVISHSAFWAGRDLQHPGMRLPGISVIDDPEARIDFPNQPIKITR